MRARRSIPTRRVAESVVLMLEREVGERQRARIPVERARDIIPRDRVPVGLLHRKTEKTDAGQVGVTLSSNRMREMICRRSRGEQMNRQRKGQCHRTGYQRERGGNEELIERQKDGSIHA